MNKLTDESVKHSFSAIVSDLKRPLFSYKSLPLKSVLKFSELLETDDKIPWPEVVLTLFSNAHFLVNLTEIGFHDIQVVMLSGRASELVIGRS